MGRTRLIHYAAALALVALPAHRLPATPPDGPGARLVRVCGSVSDGEGLYFCAGYVAAIDEANSARYMRRKCPPPIVQTQTMGIVLSQYLKRHPKAASTAPAETIYRATIEAFPCPAK